MTRVAVFVDYQNVYMRAREAFGGHRAPPFTFGQLDPRRLGLLLRAKGEAVDASRRLTSVHVYRGEPEAKHNPTGEAAWRRQVRVWRATSGVEVVTRPLQYLPVARRGQPVGWVAREKGIDVLLAIGMVMGAARDAYDVAVLASADTDLVPALEAVLALGKRVEVTSWRPDRGYGSRLVVPGRNVWCHWLDRDAFRLVRDDTDYTRPA